MATYPFATPFADWKVPAPGLRLMNNTYRAAQIDAVTGIRASADNIRSLSGNTDTWDRFVALSESYLGGDHVVQGRHLNLWNVAGASMHAAGRRLLGQLAAGDNVDAPDVIQMNDAAFYADGQGRWIMGTAPFAFVFSDDGGVFTDESADAQDNDAGDIQITPSAALATNDALYLGAAVTLSGYYTLLDRILTIGSGGDDSFVHEYWNGSAWANHSIATNDPTNPVLGDAFSRLGPYGVTWTVPGDWATTTVNGQSAYWTRIRSTGSSGTGYQSATATKLFAVETGAATRARLPAAWLLTNDPATNAAVVGWGLNRLESAGTAQVTASLGGAGTALTGVLNIYYTWRDPNIGTDGIESDPVLIGSLNPSSQGVQVTVGYHPNHRITQARIYIEGISGGLSAAPTGATSTTFGTGKLRLVATVNVGSTNSAITVSLSATSKPLPYDEIDRRWVGDGPYLASSLADEFAEPGTQHGTYLTGCAHLGRAWCATSYVNGYERRLIFSNLNNAWCFPSTNWVDLPLGENDRIMAVRSLGSALVVIGRYSVWLGTGDPGQGSFTLQQIAQVGATSKRGCVVAGQRCFFVGATTIYAVEASGSVTDVGGRIPELIRGATAAAMGNVCGVYDPTREVVAWAIPGLQAQTQGGASPGQTLCDGLLVLTLADGNYRVWLGEGCYAQSLGLYPTNDAADQLMVGSYWGRVHTFDYAATQDTQAGAIQNGTVTTGSASTTLRPTNATQVMHIASDWRQLLHFLVKYSSTTGWEASVITSYNGVDFTVDPAWTNVPASGDLWFIGAYYVAVEFGDWWLNAPGARSQVLKVQVHLEDAMPTGSVLDLAIDPTDAADTDATYAWSNDTLSGGTQAHKILATNAPAGYTQRIRLAGWQNGARWALKTISVWRLDRGLSHEG